MSEAYQVTMMLELHSADRVQAGFSAPRDDYAQSYPSLYLSRRMWDELGNPPNVVITVAPR